MCDLQSSGDKTEDIWVATNLRFNSFGGGILTVSDSVAVGPKKGVENNK